jgi:hypothetical protein
LFLSYTRVLCASFKKSSDVHLFDLSAFLCKRSEEVLEVVSAEESHLLYLKECHTSVPHSIEGANTVEGTVTRKAIKSAES